MKVDPTLPGYDAERNSGRPPWVKFRWGTHVHSFKAVVKSTEVTFTYFSSDGVPLRANVELSLEQYEPDGNWGPQNPTSGTPKPNRTHQVNVGDTLDRIAARYYGDATQVAGHRRQPTASTTRSTSGPDHSSPSPSGASE